MCSGQLCGPEPLRSPVESAGYPQIARKGKVASHYKSHPFALGILKLLDRPAAMALPACIVTVTAETVQIFAHSDLILPHERAS